MQKNTRKGNIMKKKKDSKKQRSKLNMEGNTRETGKSSKAQGKQAR